MFGVEIQRRYAAFWLDKQSSKKAPMAKRLLSIITLLFVSLVAMNFRCNKDVQARLVEHTFEVPVDIYPLKKSYSITDTIWIETDLPNKFLFDTKTNQKLLIDTGRITFGGSFNEFGTSITNPTNGFCDIITSNGVNINRQLSQWGTSGLIENYGCGSPNYKSKIGFKPNQKGAYYLFLSENQMLGSCNNKIIPYYASISYRYKSVDLGLDIFNSLSNNDKGNNEGIRLYTDKINKRECFVFRVE